MAKNSEAPKINVYTLGQHGINRVKSPIHVLDGELLSAQNATSRPVGGQLALTKRDGMAIINAETAAGELISITNIPIISFGGGPEMCIPIPDRDWEGIAYSPELELLVIVGQDGTQDRAATSKDGIDWTLQATPSPDIAYREVIWAAEPELFVAIGNNGLMTSPDGETWTARTVPAKAWWSVTYSPELNLFVGVGVACVMTSPDGVTWTDRSTPASNFTPSGFITGQSCRQVIWVSELSMFIAVGAVNGSNNQLMTSLDGTNWSRGTFPQASSWVDMAWSPELEILVATGITSVGPLVVKKAYSTNGTSWTIAPVDLPDGDGDAVAWSPELGMFVACSRTDVAGANYYSEDGINWTKFDAKCEALGNVHDVVWFPPAEAFILVGRDMVEMIGKG